MATALIVGGGYAGLRVARELSRHLNPAWKIILVDRSAFHGLVTRLPAVVTGSLPPERARIPLVRVLPNRVQLVQAEVTSIEPETKRVVTPAGSFSPAILVVATGSVPDFLGVRGAPTFSMTLKTVGDAEALHALLLRRSGSQRLRIAVVGAGYTGTEVAAELSVWRPHPGSGGFRSVELAADADRLLPDGNPRLAAAASRILTAKGVSLALGTQVSAVDSGGLLLADRRVMPADIVIWTARTQGPNLGAGWRLGPANRVMVDPYLRVVPYEDIFAAGDAAAVWDYVRDTAAPATAHMALQEAMVVAHNITASIDGRPLHEFRARPIGEALSLGGHDGVAEIGGAIVSGWPAVQLKRAALLRYLYSLGGPALVARYR